MSLGAKHNIMYSYVAITSLIAESVVFLQGGAVWVVVSDVAAVSDLLKHLSERRLTAHLLHTFLRTVATHEKSS